MTEDIISMLYQMATNIGFLLFSGLGLMIVLGMMDILNLSYPQFIMIGAYIVIACYYKGIPLFFGCIISFISLGLFGFILERLVIRRFYKNKINCLVATFALGIIISNTILVTVGTYVQTIATPFGSFSSGKLSFSIYNVFLFFVALLIIIVIWIFLYKTKMGTYARAAMEDPETAKGFGVNTDKLYALTFAFGSALAGLTGALYASTTPISPFLGTRFMAPGFLTIIVGGGENIIAGILGSAFFLGIIRMIFAMKYGSFIATISLLVSAMVIIRIMPRGISGFIEDIKKIRR
jgi:branched-chain amino acid transport system permease protein